MKKDILNKMSAETLSQMADNEAISNNFSKKLKDNFLKVGSVAVLAGLMAMSSGMAHADNGTRNTAITLSGLFGALTNGSKPTNAIDCNAQGTNGWKVGGAGALGALVGNQVGGGTGRDVATAVGGVAGVMMAQSSENDRIERECANNIKNSNRNVNGIPSYATNSSYQQAPILYEGRTAQGRTFYVTTKDSPGIAALSGRVIGQLDVNSDPLVKNAMEKGSSYLATSYQQLDAKSQEYLRVMNGGTTVAKLSRYAVDDQDVSPNSYINKEYQLRLQMAKKNFDEAYTEYARRRSVFASVADNAAVDGYNISQYGNALNYFTPPESATMTYGGKMENRYGVVPNAVRP